MDSVLKKDFHNDKIMDDSIIQVNVLSGSETITAYLKEQKDLTAGERFSKYHHKIDAVSREKFFRELLPASLPGADEQYAFEVDMDLCTGCKGCVTACHSLNGLDSSESWRSVGLIHETSGTRRQQTITSSCHHCIDPACSNGCPVNAYEKDDDTGIVQHLDDQCIGCQYCTWTCPYGAPKYNKEKGIVRKCDMCIQRLKAEEAPACVQACPNKAIKIILVKQSDVETSPENYTQLPGIQNQSYSKPSTIYKTEKNLPETMERADHFNIVKEDPHIPLVIMLVLTQSAVGITFFISLLHIFPQFLKSGLATILFPLATLLCFGGLFSSTAHIGRPLYAFRAFLGIGKSWLSREIVAFGMFSSVLLMGSYQALAASGVLVWFLPDFLLSGLVVNLTMTIAVLSGILAVYCSAMIYRATPREPWSGKITLLKFFLTPMVMGGASVLSVLFLKNQGEGNGKLLLFASTLLIISMLLKLGLEAMSFSHLKNKKLTDYKKSALIMIKLLRIPTTIRFICGFFGGVLIPLILVIAEGNSSGLFLLAFLIPVLSFVGEILERYLFFSAVIPAKMPGGI